MRGSALVVPGAMQRLAGLFLHEAVCCHLEAVPRMCGATRVWGLFMFPLSFGPSCEKDQSHKGAKNINNCPLWSIFEAPASPLLTFLTF